MGLLALLAVAFLGVLAASLQNSQLGYPRMPAVFPASYHNMARPRMEVHSCSVQPAAVRGRFICPELQTRAPFLKSTRAQNLGRLL